MDFRGALVRGWRLLVVLGLIGAVAGFFSTPAAPAKGAVAGTKSSLYLATAVIGPTGKRHTLSLGQIFLDVRNPTVLAAAAASADVGVTAEELTNSVGVENGREVLGLGKKIHNVKVKALGISVTGLNSTGPAILVNALAHAVEAYITQAAQAQYAVAVKSVAARVKTLEGQLETIDSQIAGNIPADVSGALLLTQRRVTQQALTNSVQEQLKLTLDGPTVPGYKVLVPASFAAPENFGKLTVASVVNHRSTRILGGLVVGLLVAVAIILLVEVLDRSLRTVRGTEEAFDLPVVAEIPARGARRPSLQRASVDTRLEVVVAPASPIAEAYRRLHTAVLLEPLAAEMALYGNGTGFGFANGYNNGNGYGNGNGNGIGNGVGNGTHQGQANGGELVREGNGGEGNGRASRRQVVLVVSPAFEATRSSVVANLAAVSAEGGARALVVSMGDLNWARNASAPLPAFEPNGEVDPQDLVPLSTPSSVEGVTRLQFDQVLSSRGQVVTQGPAIITAARQVADMVLIDAPSLLRSHDAMALLPAVDVVLLVAQYAVTKSDEAREAGDMLRRFRAPVLGVAFTNVPGRVPRVREPDARPDQVALEAHPDRRPEPVASGGLWL